MGEMDIPEERFVSAHRVGEKMWRGNRQHQAVVLKMATPTARIQFYMHRNNFNFNVDVDLTQGRERTLNFARLQVDRSANPATHRVVEFVYADLSGTLHLKSKSGHFYGFSSESEFLQLVRWLDKQQDVRHQTEAKLS